MIFVLMGKSATGKDTVYETLSKHLVDCVQPMVPYTTRPIREGEQEGKEYHFVTRAEMLLLEEEGKIIEQRVYHTVKGDWYYFTVAQVNVDKCDF